MKIIVETVIAAPIDEVWRAWNTPADIVVWNKHRLAGLAHHAGRGRPARGR